MWAQILAVLTATLGVISDGIQYGWTSPAIPLLTKPDSPVVISERDESWLETLYMLGGIAGLPVTIYLVDKVGRKWSIIFASSTNVIAWIMIASAHRVEILLAARFLTGMAADCAFVAAPMYIAEVADAKIRGFLGTFIYIMMVTGVLVSYCVVPFIPIWASSLVGIFLGIFQICTFFWMPKSPYYLLLKNKPHQAEKALKWLRKRENVYLELKDIEAAVERQNSERGRPIDLLIVASNRKALIIMMMLNSVQHFCGISVILMNVQSILSEAGNTTGSEKGAILFGVCMLIASLAGMPAVDKFGRKKLLISSSILSSIFLSTLGIFFLLKQEYNYDMSNVSYLPLLVVLGYAFVYKYGLGLVPIVTSGELFPTSVKAMGMTIADLIYVIMGVASIEFYYAVKDNFGIHIPFLIFGCCGLLAALFVYWYVPETKGKTLEEIQQILKGNIRYRYSESIIYNSVNLT